jgi:hypothetical protein
MRAAIASKPATTTDRWSMADAMIANATQKTNNHCAGRAKFDGERTNQLSCGAKQEEQERIGQMNEVCGAVPVDRSS